MAKLRNHTRDRTGGESASAPVASGDDLHTEAADVLVTEASDNLTTE